MGSKIFKLNWFQEVVRVLLYIFRHFTTQPNKREEKSKLKLINYFFQIIN